jgi:hypothetical protein
MAAPHCTVLDLCRGTLHRATVCVDEVLGESTDGPPERFVFFEVPPLVDPGLHIEKLLAAAWCIECGDWLDRGQVYGIETGQSLLASSYGAVDMGELSLFEIGAGGGPDEAIGPDRIRYARVHEIDLFVTPPVAGRVQQHISTIEAMYVAGPVVRSMCTAR